MVYFLENVHQNIFYDIFKFLLAGFDSFYPNAVLVFRPCVSFRNSTSLHPKRYISVCELYTRESTVIPNVEKLSFFAFKLVQHSKKHVVDVWIIDCRILVCKKQKHLRNRTTLCMLWSLCSVCNFWFVLFVRRFFFQKVTTATSATSPQKR